MRYICASIVATLVLAGTVHAQPVQWTVAEGGNGHWYQIVDGTGDSWNSHRESALSQGGDLACITSEGESQFINDLQSATGFCDAYVSLGGLQTQGQDEPDGGWYWISGEVWEYENWYAGEPNDGGSNEWGLAIFRYNGCNGQWCDIYPDAAGSGSMAFAIEWDHDPSIAQWRIEDGGNGHWYKGITCSDFCTWQEARDIALAMGGDLASVNSEQENVFIFDVIKDNTALWFHFQGVTVGPYIGGYQDVDAPDYSEPTGGWYWTDGSSFIDSYTAWNGGEPGNSCGGMPENFVNFMGYGNMNPSMLWNDIGDECHGGLAGFVVEWPNAPNHGACCVNSGCYPTTEIACSHLGGTWLGVASTCDDCPPPTCAGDTDDNDVVNIEDLLTVIGDWGPCP
jgi:hypothetical protein